jgi:acyl-CoA thioesterase-1
VLLLGLRMPPSLGPEYASSFDALYPRVAQALDVAFVPFFMEGVAGVDELNLDDGIHPTPAGHAILARNVAPALEELLRSLER